MKSAGASLCSILFLLSALGVTAQEPANGQYPFAKDSSIHKSYPARGKNVNINNKFGSVKVVIWNKNEISIDVYIVASATNADRAAAMFDAINVWDNLTGNAINFSTENSPVKGKECGTCKSKWTIDFVIHLPAGIPLFIKNSFGPIELPDYTGPLSLENSYGAINGGVLSNLTSISLSFGSARIRDMKTNNGNFTWSSVDISRLSGKNFLVFDHCKTVILRTDREIDLLDITETFSNIHIRLTKDFSAQYVIESSGGFKNNSNAVIALAKGQSSNSRIKRYQGRSGAGTGKVNIESNYGDILLDD